MWLDVLYWIDHVWSSIECVCCACGPSERLDAPSICFVCVFVCRKLSPVVVVVCHDQVRLQVSQGFRCRDS